MRFIRAAIISAMVPAIALAHAGGKDIRGAIVKFDRTLLLVKLVDGKTENIGLTPSTIYRVGKQTGRWDDMRVGLRVVVHVKAGKALEVHLPSRK